MRKKDKKLLAPVIAFLVTLGVLGTLFLVIELRSYYQKREQYVYVAANQASIMEGCMDTVIARVYTLSAMVVENDGETEFFPLVAQQIYDEVYKDTGVKPKNIAIAPAGVIEQVYPLEGNENLIGFNFMDKNMTGNEEAVDAYMRGDLVITEPFRLVQGNMGMAGRLPVYVKKNGQPIFWGLVTVTLDFDSLMDYFSLNDFDNMGINYCLWYEQENGERIVLSQSDGKIANGVSYQAKPKNLVWELEISPRNGWLDHKELSFGIIMILLVSFGIAYIVMTREKIRSVNKEISHANERLKDMAIKDSLTGCYSRHYVNTSLIDIESGEWKAKDAEYALAILDIDKFKFVNDTYGHDVGDRAIMSVAEVLKKACNEVNGDGVIRHGGDEFVVLFNHMDEEKLKERLDYILSEIRNVRFADIPELQITVSVGAMLPTNTIHYYYNMLSAADEKLYQSKEEGRNRYTI